MNEKAVVQVDKSINETARNRHNKDQLESQYKSSFTTKANRATIEEKRNCSPRICKTKFKEW